MQPLTQPVLEYLVHYLNPLESLKHRRSVRKLIDLALKLEPHDLSQLVLIFTCDTEFTPPFKSGTWHRRDARDLKKQMGVILEQLENLKAHGTFYVEGVVCERIPEIVSNISEEGHEVGCHGYAHESYGGYWKTPECSAQPDVLNPQERKTRIEKAVDAIKVTTGERPVSFKAPFDVIEGYTLSALQTLGFIVDSSLYNFVYGKPSIPYHPDPRRIDRVGNMNILELPFSVYPPPRRKWLFSCKFVPLSLICATDLKRALFAVELLRRFQSILGSPVSTLLLTSHPWEFSEAYAHIKGKTFGKNYLNGLSSFMQKILLMEKVRNLTVKNFIEYWKSLEFTSIS